MVDPVLEHRIGDRRIIRLLANIYLHYALDLWAARWRRRTATGDMIIVRYASLSCASQQK